MQLKTILNRVEPFKSFVYGTPRWLEKGKSIDVPITPRKNGHPICSGCEKVRPGYDQLKERRFEYVPLWGLMVYFVYAMRRVCCPECGVKVEKVPWCDGKHQLTNRFRWFLASWAKDLSWLGVARRFHTTWDHVYRSVRYAVEWGLAHRTLTGLIAIGVDEIQYKLGHRYLTLVYQIDEGMKRLIWIAEGRTEQALRGFFSILSDDVRNGIRFVCSDMCQAYLNVIAEQLGHAVHVLDRFHIMKKINEAIDQVRRSEAKRMKEDGYEPVLKHSRWCLLKRVSNLTKKQAVKLSELLRYNLRSVRAYLMREDFQRFWEYASVGWAGRFLDQWCTRAMRSKLEPMKAVARSLRTHRELILNWFRAKGRISAGVVEGLNNKAKLTTRKSYGFRTYKVAEIALYHNLGALPEPKFTHEFC